ncbi:putative multi-domain containing protein [Aduncisulcus paluster]|uniref:Multi-domain containing protein n=1 Tax=Aduncisulcus paluster TaxID=2918883 RepID=A0ABQ5JRZ5_9EUKA|nr:putative multi-domain containing protein [Aduncisulcus paluster]
MEDEVISPIYEKIGVAITWMALNVFAMVSVFTGVNVGMKYSNYFSQSKIEKAEDAGWFVVVAGVFLTGIYFAFKYLAKKWLDIVFKSYFAIAAEDAGWFVVVAGVFLTGIYFAFKYLAKKWLDIVFKSYFAIAVVVSVGSFFAPFIDWIVPKLKDRKLKDLRVSSLIGCAFVIPLAITIAFYGNWRLEDVVGILLCAAAISELRITSMKIGIFLLYLLLVYDVVFVFFTPIMVGVATKITIPVKFSFPRNILTEAGREGMSGMGFGDVVLPGAFLFIVRRAEHFLREKRASQIIESERLAQTKKGRKEKKEEEKKVVLPPIHIYRSCVIWYFIALIITELCCVFWRSQPALLYIVPCLSIGLFIGSVKGKCVKEVWNYEEKEEEVEIIEEEEDEGHSDESDKPKKKKE